MKKPSVFIAVPIHRAWSYESQQMLEASAISSVKCSIHSINKIFEESLIQRARNKLVEIFIKTDCTHLFFIDDDVILTRLDSIDLLISADKPVIGGVYVCKKPPYHPTFFPYGNEYPYLIGETEPFAVRYVAGGCMMIQRKFVEIIQQTRKRAFDCFDVDIPGKGEMYLSEDWGFCDRVNGFTMDKSCFIHPLVNCGHLGKYPFSYLDYLKSNNLVKEVNPCKNAHNVNPN